MKDLEREKTCTMWQGCARANILALVCKLRVLERIFGIWCEMVQNGHSDDESEVHVR